MKNKSFPVWVFFYGTFMNPDILADFGVIPTEVIPAKLNGFELYIRPRVNLNRLDRACVYGAIAKVTHTDIIRLYSYLEETFGLESVPIAVVAETLDGSFKPSLCYLATNIKDARAEQSYIDELAGCVREAGFPEWYAVHIESFGSD